MQTIDQQTYGDSLDTRDHVQNTQHESSGPSQSYSANNLSFFILNFSN